MSEIQARGISMNKVMNNISGKYFLALILGMFFIFSGSGLLSSAYPSGQEKSYQIEKAKIFRDIYELLGEVDLYCSFFIWEGEKPELVITGAEREFETNMLTDENVIYINQGKDDGLEPGQLFMVFEIEKNLPGFGFIAFKKGRARIKALADNQASAVIEKTCSGVSIGNFLVPFEPKESIMGQDLGYDVPPFEAAGAKGEFVFLQTEFNQISRGHWALINVGSQDDIQIGQQLIVYRIIETGAPLQIFANVVVIDVQKTTSTVKILSNRDPIRIGDLLMVRPAQ